MACPNSNGSFEEMLLQFMAEQDPMLSMEVSAKIRTDRFTFRVPLRLSDSAI
jgi:hypothetical protein